MKKGILVILSLITKLSFFFLLGFLVYMFSPFPVLMFENRKPNESNAAIL